MNKSLYHHKYISLYLLLIFSFIIIGCKKDPIVNENTNKINGYTDKTSYFPKEECSLYLNSISVKNIKLTISDIYGNTIKEIRAYVYPQSINNVEPWKNGFGYKYPIKFTIPDLKSGFYFINNTIPFVVRSREKKLMTLVYPSNTINAYNNSGGKSLYSYNSTNDKESNSASFMRPTPFSDEYASPEFYKWIHSKYGENINYICDKDLDNLNNFNHSEILLLPGHNEYWTRKARVNFDNYIDNGGHSIIMSGNTMWWQIRYDSTDNQMICYRDFDKDKTTNILLKTIRWNDSRLNYSITSSIGADFSNGGYGTKEDNGFDGYKIIEPNSPLLEGTNLKFGDILPLPTKEYDGAPIIGFTNNNIPKLDVSLLNFYKINLLGYDFGFRAEQTVGTFIVFQRKENSGIIINTCSTDWCSKKSMMGKESEKIKKITTNMIQKLIDNDNVFI